MFKSVLLDRFGTIDSGRFGGGERDIFVKTNVKCAMKKGIVVF